jgi:hypothetical protein
MADILITRLGTFDAASLTELQVFGTNLWMMTAKELSLFAVDTGEAARTRLREAAAGRICVCTEDVGSDLATWEAGLIDFNVQLYREVLREGQPKVSAILLYLLSVVELLTDACHSG